MGALLALTIFVQGQPMRGAMYSRILNIIIETWLVLIMDKCLRTICDNVPHPEQRNDRFAQ